MAVNPPGQPLVAYDPSLTRVVRLLETRVCGTVPATGALPFRRLDAVAGACEAGFDETITVSSEATAQGRREHPDGTIPAEGPRPARRDRPGTAGRERHGELP